MGHSSRQPTPARGSSPALLTLRRKGRTITSERDDYGGDITAERDEYGLGLTAEREEYGNRREDGRSGPWESPAPEL